MSEAMRELGVGSRFSTLALTVAMLGGLLLGGLGACSSSEPGAKSEGEALASENASAASKSSAPEQVVRQMKPSPEPSAALAGEGAAGELVSREARASTAGVTRANGGLAPRSTPGETITSKHLEAELNRLEAELAN